MQEAKVESKPQRSKMLKLKQKSLFECVNPCTDQDWAANAWLELISLLNIPLSKECRDDADSAPIFTVPCAHVGRCDLIKDLALHLSYIVGGKVNIKRRLRASCAASTSIMVSQGIRRTSYACLFHLRVTSNKQ